MYQIITVEGQTIVDIALQYYGHTDGISYLWQDNQGALPTMDADLMAGTVLNVRIQGETPELNNDVRQWLINNNIVVNSGEIPEGGGIGEETIDEDLIVH